MRKIILTQNRRYINVEQNGKATKMLLYLPKWTVLLKWPMLPCQQFQQLVLILNMLNVASFVHLTGERFFSNFSFLTNFCFIPHLDLTPHFHLPVMSPAHLVYGVEFCSFMHSRCTHCMAFSRLSNSWIWLLVLLSENQEIVLKVLNTFFFSFLGSGPQYQPPNILLTFLKQSVELFRIQIKTQTFLYYFFLLQQILKCFGAALLFDFFEFQIWSCQKLSQRFFCLST